jgi:hypothetical protein
MTVDSPDKVGIFDRQFEVEEKIGINADGVGANSGHWEGREISS